MNVFMITHFFLSVLFWILNVLGCQINSSDFSPRKNIFTAVFYFYCRSIFHLTFCLSIFEIWLKALTTECQVDKNDHFRRLHHFARHTPPICRKRYSITLLRSFPVRNVFWLSPFSITSQQCARSNFNNVEWKTWFEEFFESRTGDFYR